MFLSDRRGGRAKGDKPKSTCMTEGEKQAVESVPEGEKKGHGSESLETHQTVVFLNQKKKRPETVCGRGERKNFM